MPAKPVGPPPARPLLPFDTLVLELRLVVRPEPCSARSQCRPADNAQTQRRHQLPPTRRQPCASPTTGIASRLPAHNLAGGPIAHPRAAQRVVTWPDTSAAAGADAERQRSSRHRTGIHQRLRAPAMPSQSSTSGGHAWQATPAAANYTYASRLRDGWLASYLP
jgi:hypothetical protein